jgi:endonuclease/exonuclease/phosphatase family metal-dependent hydrolase
MAEPRTAAGTIRGRWRVGITAIAVAAAVVVAAVTLLAGPSPAAATTALDRLAGPASAADLDVMTFNLRYASSSSPNSWAQRRPVMRDLLTAEHPDLIGTQEGLAGQLRDIESDLGSRYDYIGTGREGGTQGEYVAVFYDNARLVPREHRHFWLSDTPEVVGSNTWGGAIRMVTWVRFLDRVTGGQFYAVNTHLDSGNAYARARAAQLIRNRLSALRPTLPIVMTGDFNSSGSAGNPVYDTVVRQTRYVDTWRAARVTSQVYSTFDDFRALVPGGARIDWVLTTPEVTVAASTINPYRSASGQLPSDHLPVQVRLRLPAVPDRSATEP